jgi:hypothetical protein
MKNVILNFICLLMLGFSTNNSGFKTAEFLIEGNSELGIAGSTNVNEFNCNLVFSDINSKVKALYQKDSNKIKFQDANLSLANECFDCGSRMMNSDFLEMLKTERYPNIALDLKEIIINPKNPNENIALLNISLAGSSKLYSIWLNVNQSNKINASGCLKLNLSDFNLEPPKKMLGLVVVDDAIEINLDLKIKPIK